jgi:hypothetical protein
MLYQLSYRSVIVAMLINTAMLMVVQGEGVEPPTRRM